MADEIVSETRFATNKTDEAWELHILFDYFKVLIADVFQTKSIADYDKHIVTPIGLLAHS